MLPARQRIACGQACAVGAAGVLHVMVDGKHVVPGGHRLVLEGAERAQLAFTAKGVECRAGVPHTTLVQLLDHQGYPLQVSMCFNWISVNLSAGRQKLSSEMQCTT